MCDRKTILNTILAAILLFAIQGWLIWRMHVRWFSAVSISAGWPSLSISFVVSSLLMILLWPLLLGLLGWLSALGELLFPRLAIWGWTQEFVEDAVEFAATLVEVVGAVGAVLGSTLVFATVIAIAGWMLYTLLGIKRAVVKMI